MIGLIGSRSKRRGLAGQRAMRTAERLVRRTAVCCSRWLVRGGLSFEEAAARLGLERRTLGDWWARWRKNRMELTPIGRKPARAEQSLRREILAMLGVMGTHVSEAALRHIFPACPRNELHDLVSRCQGILRRRGSIMIHALRWQRPGRVWAIDGCHAPSPVDGQYPVVLAVRDLASGESLAALPAPVENGFELAALLEALFIEHGPPLVLKSDNRACHGPEVQRVLELWNVVLLASPPATPPYNGSIEAGIGALKAEAHFEAARHDRPGQWTADDLEAARRKANETHRPWGLLEPTPDEAWNRRRAIELEERFAFFERVSEYRQEERSARGVLPGMQLDRYELADIERVAISRALIDRCYLSFRRRRFTPPISRPHVRKVS